MTVTVRQYYYWESETGVFWTTFELHCAMHISIIAVVSSIVIPKTVSLLSLQFQISHNTSSEHFAGDRLSGEGEVNTPLVPLTFVFLLHVVIFFTPSVSLQQTPHHWFWRTMPQTTCLCNHWCHLGISMITLTFTGSYPWKTPKLGRE